MIDACDQFVSMDSVPEDMRPSPEPWRRCARCRHTKAQHELPHCRSQAIIRGEIFECQRRTPHKGARCKSGEAEWGTE